MKRIIVTGAGGSAASNFISSLRMSPEQFFIVGVDMNPYHLELANVDSKYVLPNVNEPSYISKLNKLINREKIDFIHPQPDPEVLFFSKNREKFNAFFFLPDFSVIEKCQNKMKAIEIFNSKKIPVAKTFQVLNTSDLKIKVEKLLKQNDKVWMRAIKGAGSKASIPVINFNQANSWIRYWKEMKGLDYKDFMVSEFLPGNDYAFQSVWKEGKIITSQARKRMEYVFGSLTLSGQTSSPSIAVTVTNSKVNMIAENAIKAIDPKANGVFCVDLKENKFGVPCITEINAGRFFTTSNFFSTAGINMPYYYIKLAFGEKLKKLPKYNGLKEDIYWIRTIDMGYKMVKGNKWTSKKI